MKRAILTTALLLALPAGVAAQSAPDLVVLGPNVNDRSPETGERFGFIATVQNHGEAQADATTVRYLRSTDGTITTSDTLEGMDSVRALGHLQGYAATIRLRAPSTAGTYYYGACVDVVSGESSTTNNCSSSVKVTVSAPPPPPPPPPGPAPTAPTAPLNLQAGAGDGQVTLSWEAPESDGRDALTGYEVRINRAGDWISIGSTDLTYTITELTNGQTYVFEVRAVNSVGPSPASNAVEATPMAEEVILEFAHFGNGVSGNDVLITSDLVLVNVAASTSRPVIYFFDRAGNLLDAESVVDLGDDFEVGTDGGLSPTTAMVPLDELTISTHGQGEVVTGSVRVVSEEPIGGVVRFDIPRIGVVGVGASEATRDALFPVRRQAGGIRTAVAIHNVGMEAIDVQCLLMKNGVVMEERAIELDGNGQDALFIEELFTATDTTDFVGSVRCTVPRGGLFTGIAVEMDADNRIFTTLPVVPVQR